MYPQPRYAAPQPVASAPRAIPSVAASPYQSTPSDPGGFTAWLNNERARRGLSAVVCDASLCGWAAANSARGFGHFVMGSARRQNAGVGSLAQVSMMWVASPAHASALFDPTITRIGIAAVGSVWTYDAN
jgi:uncharacterized protein YkwD